MSDLITKKENNKSMKKERIKMKSISFTDCESDGVRLIPTTVYTWQDANKFILERALTKKDQRRYLKTLCHTLR